MDILTLVKSNIRHKKGTFLCIMVFMMIISSSIASIVSLKKNFKDSIESAYEHMEGGDITLNIRRDFLTEEMIEEVESHSDVKKVLAMDTILSDGYTLPDGSSGSFNLFLTEYDSRVDKLWKSDMTGYEEVVPELKKGEIYLPQAISKSENLSIGDRLAISFGDKKYDFTIKGFVEEPVCGSAFIPVKSGFISSEDSKEITEYLEGEALVNPAVREFLYSIVYIYKADNCTLSDNRFASVINNDTEIGSYATSVLTKTDSIHYQDLYPDLTLDIFLSYVLILIVIVFVVMSNSISTGIELQYTDLGILKAEGFYNLRLKIIFLIQYMLAEIFGAIFGLLMSLSVIKYLPGSTAFNFIYQGWHSLWKFAPKKVAELFSDRSTSFIGSMLIGTIGLGFWAIGNPMIMDLMKKHYTYNFFLAISNSIKEEDIDKLVNDIMEAVENHSFTNLDKKSGDTFDAVRRYSKNVKYMSRSLLLTLYNIKYSSKHPEKINSKRAKLQKKQADLLTKMPALLKGILIQCVNHSKLHTSLFTPGLEDAQTKLIVHEFVKSIKREMGKFFKILKRYDDIDVYIDKLNQIEADDLPQRPESYETTQIDRSSNTLQSDGIINHTELDESDDCTRLFTQDLSK